MIRLQKASEEKTDFYDLIGTEVTFNCQIITIGGQIINEKGDKRKIVDVEYIKGYWSNLCSDIYIKPKISSFTLENETACSFSPRTFLEYKDYETDSKYTI